MNVLAGRKNNLFQRTKQSQVIKYEENRVRADTTRGDAKGGTAIGVATRHLQKLHVW
jgi:hypothetical protein